MFSRSLSNSKSWLIPGVSKASPSKSYHVVLCPFDKGMLLRLWCDVYVFKSFTYGFTLF